MRKTLYSVESNKQKIKDSFIEKKFKKDYEARLEEACNYYKNNVPDLDTIYESVLNKVCMNYNFSSDQILEKLILLFNKKIEEEVKTKVGVIYSFKDCMQEYYLSFIAGTI